MQNEMQKCLVICPFGERDSDIRQWSDFIFNDVIKPATDDAGYEAYRALDNTKPGEITTRVVEDLHKADLVIADLTGSNPNVFYELALRHAIAKPFIHICRSDSQVPFDIAQLNVIEINTGFIVDGRFIAEYKEVTNAHRELRNQIEKIKDNDTFFDNPAYRYRLAVEKTMRSKEQFSVKVFHWSIRYTSNFARKWLDLQNERLQECVEQFNADESQIPNEPRLRNGLVEYLAYKLAHGLTQRGDLYYIVDNTTRFFKGWGNFLIPGSQQPMAIQVEGNESIDEKDIDIQFDQAPRKVSLGLGLETEIRGFTFSIQFTSEAENKAILNGRMYHPDFDSDGPVLGKSQIVLRPEVSF